MSQKITKMNRRAVRRMAQKEKKEIVYRYVNENWDMVIRSAVSLIRSFKFKTRFCIAMTILFKPIKIKKGKEAIEENSEPDGKEPQEIPIQCGQMP